MSDTYTSGSDQAIQWFREGELWVCRECRSLLWHENHGDHSVADLDCVHCGHVTMQDLVARSLHTDSSQEADDE